MSPVDVVAFLSHATADNDRFVVPFNAALALRGIRTILDVQDFRPGQSLIRHIFDDGIESANAFVIIISKNTATRPWIRAELEHAIVRNIEDAMPVIPVILDGAPVPAPLRSRLQIRVEGDLTPEAVAGLVADALMTDHAPHVRAEHPGDARWRVAGIGGLRPESGFDDYVARYSIDQMLNHNIEYFDVAPLLAQIEQDGGTAEDVDAALHELELRGEIKRHNEGGARLPISFTLTAWGADAFLTLVASDLYRKTFAQVLQHVKRAYPGGADISQISADLAAPPQLVRHVGKMLEREGVARVEEYVGGEGDIIGEPSIRFK